MINRHPPERIAQAIARLKGIAGPGVWPLDTDAALARGPLQLKVLRADLELLQPWVTPLGSLTERGVVLVRAEQDGVVGWGECVALPEPTYSAEYSEGAAALIENRLIPLVLQAHSQSRATGEVTDAIEALDAIRGNRMARSAVSGALIDLRLRQEGRPLAEHLMSAAGEKVRRAQVPAGVAIGIPKSIEALVAEVAERVEDQQYRRIKLKIRPGWDIQPVQAVRSHWGPERLSIMVDANGSYSGHPDAPSPLGRLDRFGVDCLEQPLGVDDLVEHAKLAGRIGTPICLDESIESLDDLQTAAALGALRVVNLKVGRVGGIQSALDIYRWCRDQGLGLWIGGMLESGVGRAVNVAMASLPAVNLIGDLSGSDRFWKRDLTEQDFVVDADGNIAVPTGAGIGVEVRSPL